MIEIYMMVSLAPVPMATWGNHEQSHIGQNYLKSLFALGFQGFLILICVAIYAVLIQNAATFLGVLALVGLAAGGGIYTFMKQKQKKQAEKEALDPDANYTEDKGDFEIPVEDEPEETGEEDNTEE